MAAASVESGIHLYTFATPNGVKSEPILSRSKSARHQLSPPQSRHFTG